MDEKTSVGIYDKSSGGRKAKIYNLDVIISGGYRVKSKNGTTFRQWANKILKDYILIYQELNKDEVCVNFAHTTEHGVIQGKK